MCYKGIKYNSLYNSLHNSLYNRIKYNSLYNNKTVYLFLFNIVPKMFNCHTFISIKSLM